MLILRYNFDMHSAENSRQLNPILICRVTLGNVFYTDEEYSRV